MHIDQVTDAARLVAQHRLAHTQLPQLPQPVTVEDGYRIQEHTQALLSKQLGAVVGHKIGATNSAIQAKLGVGHPCAGGVYASTVWKSGVRLSVGNFVRPGLECEIAFRFGRDITPRAADYSRSEVMDSIDACMVSMEIVDNRHVDLSKIHIPTLIADDTLDAGVLLGEAQASWRDLDFPDLSGTIFRDGAQISTGKANNVLGDPINAMVWIANTYSRLGRTLKRGEFVSTGSIADLIWVKAGEHYDIEVEKLGRLEVTFI